MYLKLLMDKFYIETLSEIETAINELEIEADYSIQRIEVIISLILKHLSDLKKYIQNKEFNSIEEEIYFFKHQKPIIVSKLVYYNAIYKIEAKKPIGTKQVIEEYLNSELDKLKKFYDNNLDFYKYYRTNSSYLDYKYFTRGNHEIKLGLDAFYFEADHNSSTSHDFKVAKIMANDLIQIYLENELKLVNKLSPANNLLPEIRWTASKTALTELIYALYSQGSFDNGNIDIKIIAKAFEFMFKVDLGDFYHTFLELKYRKTNRTKFIDALREALIKKMEEQDEK